MAHAHHLRGGDMFGYTHTTAGDGSALKRRFAISPTTKTIHIRRIAISNQGAATPGIKIERADSISGGTGVTEFGFSSNGATPSAAVVTTVTTGTITPTGAETLDAVDLANPDREEWTFPRGMMVLNPNHTVNKHILIQVPTGSSATHTITVWWQEDPSAAG